MSIPHILLHAALLASMRCGGAFKVLGVFPMAAHSHFSLGFRLMQELADRGHEVTFINSYPQKEPIRNLKHVSAGDVGRIVEKVKVDLFDLEKESLISILLLHYSLGSILTNATYSSEEVQRLLKSEATFDVVVLEDFLNPSLVGFAHRFEAPFVFFSAVGPSQWTNTLFGNPSPSSYVPNVLTPHTSHMNFPERLHNFLVNNLDLLYRHSAFYPAENAVLHRYIPDAPHLDDIMYNASLVLLNSHSSYKDPVPLLPNMIEIGGFHVTPLKPLPEGLQEFLDDAPNGAVYFSMGSNLNSSNMPFDKKTAVLKVFARIKQKVLWKFEGGGIEELPKNVKIDKWLPQQDILAHPNVKAFVSHGGLLSTIEAIYHGVPMLGIPIFWDQKANVATAVEKGYAVGLRYRELTEDNFEKALREILDNPRYSQNVKMRSKLMKDRPQKPIDTAVHWIEYVARNGRVVDFRSSALNLSWYQLFMFDVVIFMFVVFVALLLSLRFVIKIIRI